MNVFITGTNAGIGFGLTKYYLDLGYNVYGISRSSNNTLENYSNFKFLSQDLSDFDNASKSVASFLEGIDILDLVILNAGVLNVVKDLKDTSLDEIQQVMDINVWANKVLIDIILEKVRYVEQIVAISSAASKAGSRGWNAYSLSKATLNTKIKMYSNEHPETHFCSLCPGPVDTKMQDLISEQEENDRYPDIGRLKRAKESSQMPNIDEAAIFISDAISKAKELGTGHFWLAKELLGNGKRKNKTISVRRIVKKIIRG